MSKGDIAIDPRGLIYESYRIDGIVSEECRAIFFDWALGVPADEDMKSNLEILMEAYGRTNPDHPMTAVLREGLDKSSTKARRRGGRGARHA